MAKKIAQLSGAPSRDEINPCIVWNLNRKLPGKIYDSDKWLLERIAEITGQPVEQSRFERVKAYFAEFITKFDIARKAAMQAKAKYDDKFDAVKLGKQLGSNGPFVPLAYRLDVLTSDEVPLAQDDLGRDKFGGLPDLRAEVFSYCVRGQAQHDMEVRHYGKGLKNKDRPTTKSLAEGLAAEWPKCGCCGKYMRFVGQLNYSDWRAAIHLATKAAREGWYSEVSAMGASRDADSNLMEDEHHLFFYCPCNNFDSPNNDSALVRISGRSTAGNLLDRLSQVEADAGIEDKAGIRRTREVPPYTEEQYKAAVTRFMKKHGIHPSQLENDTDGTASDIPLQFVEGYSLGFDVDWIGYGLSEVQDAVQEALPSNAGEYGSHYTLFGEPRSQQEPKRYMNIRGYSDPMRQAPLLNWNDNGHDFSYQIYGDFRTHERFGPPMACKYDGSCT